MKKPRCEAIHPMLFIECQKPEDHDKDHWFSTMWTDAADVLDDIREHLRMPEADDLAIQRVALDAIIFRAAAYGVQPQYHHPTGDEG